MTDTEAKILQVIADKLEKDVENANGDSRLVEDLYIENFELLELICRIEDTFNIQIPGRQALLFVTVKHIADFIDNPEE
jgi:acyl carrier protein